VALRRELVALARTGRRVEARLRWCVERRACPPVASSDEGTDDEDRRDDRMDSDGYAGDHADGGGVLFEASSAGVM